MTTPKAKSKLIEINTMAKPRGNRPIVPKKEKAVIESADIKDKVTEVTNVTDVTKGTTDIINDAKNIVNDNKDITDSILKDALLSSKPIKREYTQVSADLSAADKKDIAEPTIQPPRPNIDNEELDLLKGKDNDTHDDTRELGPKVIAAGKETDDISDAEDISDTEDTTPAPGDTTMPAMQDADKKTKKAGAEYLADSCIQAYVEINKLGKSYVQLDEEKLKYKSAKGKFDFALMQLRIPLSSDGQQYITVKQFIDSINEGAEKIFVVTDEFKQKVRPLLVKIFMSKGWGLTPEQQLIGIVIQDAYPKLIAIFDLKSQVSQILDIAMELLAAERKRTKAQATIITEPGNDHGNDNKDTIPGSLIVADKIKEPGE